MSSNFNSSGCYKAIQKNSKIFKKKSFNISHLNINSLLPEIYETRFIANQSNASIIVISESKLDSSILSSDLDIEHYNLVRLGWPRK